MLDVLVFSGIGLLGGVTNGTVLHVGRAHPTPKRDLFWVLIGAVIGGPRTRSP